MKIMVSLLALLACVTRVPAEPTNAQERIRTEYLGACIKLHFVGDEKLAIAGLRDMLKTGDKGSEAVVAAHTYLESLGSRINDIPNEGETVLEACRKKMTPEEFLAFVEKAGFKLRSADVSPQPKTEDRTRH